MSLKRRAEMMSKFFEMAKRNYDRGFWSVEMLRTFTALGRITAAEYREITGEEYAPVV